MGMLRFILIAIALGADAFTISSTRGFDMGRILPRNVMRIAAFFGGFQALMPIIGFYAGMGIRGVISGAAHWTAFGLLTFVGAKKIYDSLFGKKKRRSVQRESVPTLLMLSIASSIDALAVGFSLSLIHVNVFLAAAVFGIVTFIISILGVFVGKEAGKLIGNRIGIIGGIVIIGIAVEIILHRR